MGFFVGRPRIVSREPGWYAVPGWLGPPQGWLPGYAPERAVVFRTSEALLVAGRFDVYPTGAEFTLHLEMRTPEDERTFMPWEFRNRPPERDEDLPDELLRLGVIFADGSSWSNLDAPPATIEERPPGPLVMMRQGGGDRGSWMMNAWLWPLPPDGPLTFVAEWPKYRIAESRADVDGARVRAAAADAEQLWPDDGTASAV